MYTSTFRNFSVQLLYWNIWGKINMVLLIHLTFPHATVSPTCPTWRPLHQRPLDGSHKRHSTRVGRRCSVELTIATGSKTTSPLAITTLIRATPRLELWVNTLCNNQQTNEWQVAAPTGGPTNSAQKRLFILY